MDSLPLHYSNLLLPSIEREGISEDEKQSNLKILSLLEKLQSISANLNQKNESVPFGCLEDIGLALRQHRALKFYFSESLRLATVESLLPLYLQGSEILSYPNRTAILQMLRLVLRKTWTQLSITLDWRPFWHELLTMVHREKRYESNCAMNVFINHRDTLTAFLFNCRHYFDPVIASPQYPIPELQDNLIEYAMNLLANIRVMSCVEGLLALIFCLPNHFSQFDQYLPKWLQLWSMIDNNQVWDFCWIVLLCRATKHPIVSQSYPWHSLVPFLLTKAKYILGISPSVQSDSFPKGIPSYYQQLLIMWNDMDAKATTKFTKVLFHAIQADRQTVTLSKVSITPPNLVQEALHNYLEAHPTQSFPAITDELITVKSTCLTLCQFFQTIRPFFHPSNTQPNAILIARLIEVFLRAIVKSIATEVGKVIITMKTPISTPPEGIDTLTWNTYQYLQGYCFLILVESMNSTNFVQQGINAISVNHLISMNPLFIHLLTPFLLDALEPKSISQPQRILSALNIFSSNMRTMLYPNPCILQYLPSLLRLSLSGLDPSDAQKSLDTMDLFTHIFYWIPIHPNSETDFITKLEKNPTRILPVGSYCNLLSMPSSSTSSVGVIPAAEMMEIQTHTVALFQYLTTEWIYEFLDRIFLLIEGLDKGTAENGLEISDLLYKIIYCNSIIFQAMVPSIPTTIENDSFAAAIEERILQYILREASSHVSKISGKLIVSIVANRPYRFPSILSKILDEEMLCATASEDKMRYRFQLAAACSRMTLNEHALPTIQSLFYEGETNFASSNLAATVSASIPPLLRYDKRYLYHKELKVRKAYVKWVKDVLRGLSATYPIDIKPCDSNRSSSPTGMIASPIIPEANFMTWNIPTAKTVHFIVEFLQHMTGKLQEEILLALDTAIAASNEEVTTSTKTTGTTTSIATATTANTTSTGTEEKLTAKKCEEIIGANLSLLTKLLRGGAELFGDSLVNAENIQDRTNWCLYTGRERLLQQLSLPDQQYLCSYRHSLLGFLRTIMEKIRQIPETSPYYILHNHSVLAGLWMRVFYLLIARRISFLKNPEVGLGSHNYQKLTDDSIFARTIYEYMKFSSSERTSSSQSSRNIDGSSLIPSIASNAFLEQLCDINYWKFHDRTLNWIALKAWYQRSVRIHIYAYNSIQLVHAPDVPKSELSNCLEELFFFGSHIYDTISVQGTKLYAQMTLLCAPTLFASIMTRFFERLSTTSLSFYELVAILEISKAIGVLSRWTGNLHLKLQFFQAMPTIIAAISRIEDLEKMQMANLSLSDLFSLYSMTWNHTLQELRLSQEHLLPMIFQSTTFGRLYLEEGKDEMEGLLEIVTITREKGEAEGITTTNTTTAMAMNHNRSDILLGYLLLHLIDPSLIEERIPLSFWKMLWKATLHYLSLNHYHPLQPIFEAVAIRLIEIVYVLYQEMKEKEQLHLLAHHEKYQFVKELWTMSSDRWSRLFYGLVHSRAVIIAAEEEEQEDDGNGGGAGIGGGFNGGSFRRPGWAAELETIAHATEYLKIVKTRWFTAKMFEYNLSSDYFRKEIAAAMFSLIESNILVDQCFQNEQQLSDFLQLWKQLPLVNDGERKSCNYLQSELFGGLYRAFLQHRSTLRDEEETERERYEQLDQVFCQFLLQDILESISLEYGRDWQEAISFALEDTKVEVLGRLHEELLQRFRQAVQETSKVPLQTELILTEDNDEMEDEGEEGDDLMDEVDEEIEEMHLEEEEEEEESEEGGEGKQRIDNEEEETADDTLMEGVDGEEGNNPPMSVGEGQTLGLSTKTTTTAVTLDEGFARRSKIYMFTFGLLNGDCIARVTAKSRTTESSSTSSRQSLPTSASELLVAKEIIQILIDPETNVLSPYYTSRYEFASIINTLIDFFSYQAYYYPHPEKPFATVPGEVDPPAYYLLLPLLYSKITSGILLPSAPVAPSPMREEAREGVKLTLSGDESLSSRLLAEEDRSSSPPRKKTMLVAPSHMQMNSAFLQSWDQQSLASRSGDPVPFSYSTDSSTLLGPPIAPTNTLSKSVSFDYSIANEGGRNTIPSTNIAVDSSNTGSSSNNHHLQTAAMTKSTDSNDGISLLVKPPKIPVTKAMESSDLAISQSHPSTSIPAYLTEPRQQLLLKQTIDTIQHILQDIIRWIPIQWISPALHNFFPVLIQGLIHSEVEVINKSADALMMIVNGLFPPHYLPSYYREDEGVGEGGTGKRSNNNSSIYPEDFHQAWIDQLQSLYQIYSFSWKIKAMIIQLSLTFLTQQWFYLSTFQRQSIKTLFMNGIKDEQLNIRGIAASGMICYLAFKTPQELQEIAELYTRNSEKLATREKNRRRKLKSLSRDSQDSNDSILTGTNTTMTRSTVSTGMLIGTSNSSIPDGDYMLNIQMMSCLILTRSYDLPPYLPKLIATFLRHRYYYDINKLIITKTIQMFQETHHDRWEEYQLQFTTDQLMELQGVGAAYYFA